MEMNSGVKKYGWNIDVMLMRVKRQMSLKIEVSVITWMSVFAANNISTIRKLCNK